MSSFDSLELNNIHRKNFRDEDHILSDHFANHYPPFLNITEKPNQTKLSKLLKAAELGTSLNPFLRHQEKKQETFERANSIDHLKLTPKVCFLRQPENEGEFVIDSILEKGIFNLLKSMKQAILQLAQIEKKPKGIIHLALLKSNKRRRRRSDCSTWSGGNIHFEQSSSFLVYNYIPALVIQETLNRKDSSPLYLKNQLEGRSSSRQRETSATSAKRISAREDFGLKNSIATLITQDSNQKLFNVNDASVMRLTDELRGDDIKEKNDFLKELLRSLASPFDTVNTNRIIVLNMDQLKDMPDSNMKMNNNSSQNKSYHYQENSGFDLAKGVNDMSPKLSTNVDLKPIKKKKLKSKVHSLMLISHMRHKSLTEKTPDLPPIQQPNALQKNKLRMKDSRVHSPQPNEDTSQKNKHIKGKSVFGEQTAYPKLQIHTSSPKMSDNLYSSQSRKESGSKSTQSTQSFLYLQSPLISPKSVHSSNLPSKFKEEKEKTIISSKKHSLKLLSTSIQHENPYQEPSSNQTLTDQTRNSPLKSRKKVPSVKTKGFERKSLILPVLSSVRIYSNKLGSKGLKRPL